MLYIMAPITLFTVLLDLLSRKVESVRKIMHFAVGKMLRPHEAGNEILLNGASVGISFCAFVHCDISKNNICLLIFHINYFRYFRRALWAEVWEAKILG